jgi:hypothetical protein
MKKIYLSLFLMAVAILTAQSQTLVSTRPLNKNIILEEFTGIHCQYCPEGHAIASDILASHPGRAAVIAIHQGSYASPGSGEPDYRTAFGNSIAGQTALSGYPSGTVNRHVFSGSATALGRESWTSNSDIILQQPSPVNVGIESSFNAATRELTVHVELYYTASSLTATNYINVALIQNHIFGPQTGGNAGNNYEHMRMLRHLITGQWGDPVTATTEGSLVEKTYTYTVPESFTSIPCVLENCQVVAFVTESHQEVLSGDVVQAINGTNIYVGDVSTSDSVMKLGQPGMTTSFNLFANGNISGTGSYKIKLISDPLPGWSAAFEINAQTYADSAVVSLVKGTPLPLTLHVTPGDSAGFETFTFELASLDITNAPVRYFSVNVLSNVNTLIVNAAGDNNATLHQDVYIKGLKAAGCNRLAVIKSNLFVQAKNAGILSGILHIFYNCAWTFPAFTDPEATALKSFVDNGKNLLVAGQDIGWDIMSGADGSHGTPVTQDFYTNYLKATFVGDGNSANNRLVADTGDPIFGAVATSNIVDVYGGNMYPDQITPLDNATAVFYYNTTLTKIAAIKSTQGLAKVTYFGVGLEMLQNEAIRNDLIRKTYDWFMPGVGISETAGTHIQYLGQNFPNPANDETTIRFNSVDRDMVLQISDITGRILVSQPVKAGSDRIRLSTSSLGNGLYLYHLLRDGKVVATRKLTIQR